jgi:2,3-bisphosphoglycerate-dependent phosphoglycerate mutase
MKIFIVRHAESFNNPEPDPLKWKADPELTDRGCQQADLVAGHLLNASPDMLGHSNKYAFDQILTSPQLRALQTAWPISQALGSLPYVWTLICEHQGTNYKTPETSVGLPGMTRGEISAQFPGFVLPDDVTDDGWWDPNNNPEDIKTVWKRGQRAAQELLARAEARKTTDPSESVLLVSHGTFSNGLIHGLLGLEPGAYHYGHNNTGITRIDVLRNRQPVLRYTNRITHIPPELISQ